MSFSCMTTTTIRIQLNNRRFENINLKERKCQFILELKYSNFKSYYLLIFPDKFQTNLTYIIYVKQLYTNDKENNERS